MPKPQTLEAFVALVEAGRFVEAIERFHADDATMQENHRPPRVGDPALCGLWSRTMRGEQGGPSRRALFLALGR